MERAKYQIFNSLILKIIAIITMSFDHIGIFLTLYANNNNTMVLTGDIFRIIGRISFPLIALLVAEAMRYSKDKEKYLARLGLMAVIVLGVGMLFYFYFKLAFGNVFITLISGASFIYFFEKKDKKRYLAIIPVLVIGLSFAIDINEYYVGSENAFLPTFLKGDYSLYGFLLIVGSYFAYYLVDKRVISLTKGERNIEELRNYSYYRSFTNILWIALLLILTIIFWLLSYANFDIYRMSLQSYALIAIIPIIFYNGYKGYNNKIIQYSFYFYYPIHILIIFLSFYLALGVIPI